MGSLVSLRDEFRVEEITGTDVVPLTYEFRYRVRSKEIRLIDSLHQMGIICDEHESRSRHWAAFSWEGILGASARLCIHDSQQHVPDSWICNPSKLPKIREPLALLLLPRIIIAFETFERFGFSLKEFRAKSHYLGNFWL